MSYGKTVLIFMVLGCFFIFLATRSVCALLAAIFFSLALMGLALHVIDIISKLLRKRQ